MKTGRKVESAPIVILATHIIEDISELCMWMAIINRHEIQPEHLLIDLKTDDNIKGVRSGR